MAQSVLYRLISHSPYHSTPPLTLTRFFSCLRRGFLFVSSCSLAWVISITIIIFRSLNMSLSDGSRPILLNLIRRIIPHYIIFSPLPSFDWVPYPPFMVCRLYFPSPRSCSSLICCVNSLG